MFTGAHGGVCVHGVCPLPHRHTVACMHLTCVHARVFLWQTGTLARWHAGTLARWCALKNVHAWRLSPSYMCVAMLLHACTAAYLFSHTLPPYHNHHSFTNTHTHTHTHTHIHTYTHTQYTHTHTHTHTHTCTHTISRAPVCRRRLLCWC